MSRTTSKQRTLGYVPTDTEAGLITRSLFKYKTWTHSKTFFFQPQNHLEELIPFISPPWEANSCVPSHKIPRISSNPKVIHRVLQRRHWFLFSAKLVLSTLSTILILSSNPCPVFQITSFLQVFRLRLHKNVCGATVHSTRPMPSHALWFEPLSHLSRSTNYDHYAFFSSLQFLTLSSDIRVLISVTLLTKFLHMLWFCPAFYWRHEHI
jgi:hypothetical protein